MSAIETADVVIAGGAAWGRRWLIILPAIRVFPGASSWWRKIRLCAPRASALSAASIRQQFSSPVNIRISLYGIAFLRAIGTHLAIDGEAP